MDVSKKPSVQSHALTVLNKKIKQKTQLYKTLSARLPTKSKLKAMISKCQTGSVCFKPENKTLYRTLLAMSLQRYPAVDWRELLFIIMGPLSSRV